MNRREFHHLTLGLALTGLGKARPVSTPASVVVIGAGIIGASIAYHLMLRDGESGKEPDSFFVPIGTKIWSSPMFISSVRNISYHLCQRGVPVTILEKERPASGATAKSFAWLNSTFSQTPRSYQQLLKGADGRTRNPALTEARRYLTQQH